MEQELLSCHCGTRECIVFQVHCFKAYIPPGVFGRIGVNNGMDFALGKFQYCVH